MTKLVKTKRPPTMIKLLTVSENEIILSKSDK